MACRLFYARFSWDLPTFIDERDFFRDSRERRTHPREALIPRRILNTVCTYGHTHGRSRNIVGTRSLMLLSSLPPHSEMSIHARLYPAKSLYVRTYVRNTAAHCSNASLVASHLVVASTRTIAPTRERSSFYIRGKLLENVPPAIFLMRENLKM